MGKNHTVYLHDDIETYLMDNPTFPLGKAINDLLRVEFNQTESTLREKQLRLDKELNRVKCDLNEAITNRLKSENKKQENTEEINKRIKRQSTIDNHVAKWKAGLITDEEYWAFFNGE